MAHEDQKDFNAMLHDQKDMPKQKVITDMKSIEKYGGSHMLLAPPIDYDEMMRTIPYGYVTTVKDIRVSLAKRYGADFTDPITAEYSYP